ncbi:MAG: hypothetical protein JNL58_31160 [Planctomyces sp.]|nr:hypothetical protein [Planctomyces sp.]
MNPYQSTIPAKITPGIPTASSPSSPATNRLIVVAAAAVVGFPLFSLTLVFMFWLFAWKHLGHRPIPYVDDPKGLGSGFAVAQIVVSLLVIVTPVAVFATLMGLLGGLFVPIGRLRTRALVLLYYIIQNVLLFMLVRADPFRVIEWLAD